ncbi:MAG TPA: helix-turn-helix domain-containing protein, partial [Ktedonobacterales bacterium]
MTHSATARRHRVPAHLAHLHPDWRPPDDLDAPAHAGDSASDALPPPPIRIPTGLPAGLQPAACPTTPDPLPTTPPTSDPGAERRPIDSLDHETIARELRDDPMLAREFRADPWLAAQIADLIGPQPRPILPLSTTPDGTTPTPLGAPIPPGATAATTTTALPLRERIYTLYCQGHSQSAIARTLQLDRGTVARHLAAVQDDLAQEQTARLAELRHRAVDAQFAILAAAWDALAREEARETEWLANARIPYPPTDTKIVPYHAQRARLLAIAAHAARTAAQLQGLFTPTALQAAL